MAKRKIYAVYDKDIFMGNHTAREISVLLDVPYSRVRLALSTGITLSGRYTFDEIGQADNREEALLREWDEARLKILGEGEQRSEPRP